MGFWNSVIYIVTSRAACRDLFRSGLSFIKRSTGTGGARLSSLAELKNHGGMGANNAGRVGSPMGGNRSGPKTSWGDSHERLREEDLADGETKARGGMGVEEV